MARLFDGIWNNLRRKSQIDPNRQIVVGTFSIDYYIGVQLLYFSIVHRSVARRPEIEQDRPPNARSRLWSGNVTYVSIFASLSIRQCPETH